MPPLALFALTLIALGSSLVHFPYLAMLWVMAPGAAFLFVFTVRSAGDSAGGPPVATGLLAAGLVVLLLACMVGGAGYGEYLWQRDRSLPVVDVLEYRLAPVAAALAAWLVASAASPAGDSPKFVWALAAFACFPATILFLFLISRVWPLSA
jgi:hypothetical protein